MTHQSIHARCNNMLTAAFTGIKITLICGKSNGHTSPEHYDPSYDQRWTGTTLNPVDDPRYQGAAQALVASLGDDNIALPRDIIKRATRRILARIDAQEQS